MTDDQDAKIEDIYQNMLAKGHSNIKHSQVVLQNK